MLVYYFFLLAQVFFQTLEKFNHQTFKKGLIQTNAFRKSLTKNATQASQKESVMTKIVVIIPVKHEEAKIERCLEVVFNQTVKPFEVIVVDGYSTE